MGSASAEHLGSASAEHLGSGSAEHEGRKPTCKTGDMPHTSVMAGLDPAIRRGTVPVEMARSGAGHDVEGAGIGSAVPREEPTRAPREEITHAPRDSLEDRQTSPQTQIGWRDVAALARHPAVWAMTAGLFGEVYTSWLYQTWLPAYLEQERHMSVPRTGLIAGIPFLFAIVGSVGSGWLSGVLTKRGVSAIDGCRWPVVAGMLGMALFTAAAALASNTWIAVAAISAAMFCGGMAGAMAIALPSVMAPERMAASLHGLQNCGGFAGGALAPLLTGLIADAAGSFAPALLFSAGLGCVSAAIYAFAVPGRPIVVVSREG